MRVLMLTSDVVIDRRILQEAETLMDHGHEVILLAKCGTGLPVFERIGRVKVERMRHDLVLLRLRIRKELISILKLLVAPIHGGIRRAMSALAWFLGNCLPGLGPLLLAVMRRVRRWFLRIRPRRLALLVQAALRRLLRRDILLPFESLIVDRVLRYEPDIIHAHDLPDLKVAVRASRRLRVPLVYDAHELYPEINTLSRAQKRHLSQMENDLLRYCDHTITVNPFIAAEMAERYNIPEPTVIYNAVNRPDGFDPTVPPNRFRETMPIAKGDAVLLYQGWMSPTRGLQALIRAMSLVDDGVHLVMMGYGAAREELARIVEEEALAGKVHFKDAVDQAELLFWTASADAGIIPYQPVDLNNYYCSPNKLFEFIQAALPIIVNDLPFLRKVVGQEEFGIVTKLEGEAQYAQAIREMFDEIKGGPGRFRQRLLGRAADYNWSSEEKKLLSIYGQLQRK